MTDARNVFGEPLAECCTKPMTGFYRDGSCNTGPEDLGLHTVCTKVDAAFLAFSRAAGNDLSTPVPEFGFPGLKPGDCWCLCAERWKEALEAGKAPKVRLTATHEATLEIVPLEVLGQFMRLISLSVRLFANMLAGHMLILTFIGLIFVLQSVVLAVIAVPAATVFYIFEVVIVVSIQAFIFAALSAIYIGSAIEPEH